MSLQVKVVAFLLVIATIPLAVAAVLIDQTATVAHNFASNEAAYLRPPLIEAKSAYLDLIATKRDLYYPQVAMRVAEAPAIRALVAPLPPVPAPETTPPAPGESTAVPTDPPGLQPADPPALELTGPPVHESTAGEILDEFLATTSELQRIAVIDAQGESLIARETLTPRGVHTLDWRPFDVEAPVASTGARVRLVFAADVGLQADYGELLGALDGAAQIDDFRSALPSFYRIAFLALVGGVVLLVSAAGIVVARRFTRRIYTLVSGTRLVAAGDLDSRVELPGRDELAELARAFNRMLEDLQNDREQIAYLQRVSTWQDVARKLAHEIKNPLTPIQLAVQQCVSSYRGDDERYGRLLGDAEEIVTEEISSLRRLVDAFRTLGQLPRVEARPMDLGVVVDDLEKDPTLLGHIAIRRPDQPAMIRGDRMLLRRVLTNLVENGMHAGQGADRDGAVAIRWSQRDGRVRLTVDDEGPGVPPDKRGKIFEPYVTHKEQGTGLGLTISKKIALEHRGSLELASDPSPMGGARFVLTLPLAAPEETEQPAEQETAERTADETAETASDAAAATPPDEDTAEDKDQA